MWIVPVTMGWKTSSVIALTIYLLAVFHLPTFVLFLILSRKLPTSCSNQNCVCATEAAIYCSPGTSEKKSTSNSDPMVFHTSWYLTFAFGWKKDWKEHHSILIVNGTVEYFILCLMPSYKWVICDTNMPVIRLDFPTIRFLLKQKAISIMRSV